MNVTVIATSFSEKCGGKSDSSTTSCLVLISSLEDEERGCIIRYPELIVGTTDIFEVVTFTDDNILLTATGECMSRVSEVSTRSSTDHLGVESISSRAETDSLICEENDRSLVFCLYSERDLVREGECIGTLTEDETV